ncbi:DUF1801 domain-containing protein [Parapedobacter sp. 10938]|uniref:DUF1801 domain-containing protein n=1 Tax=Parapedobacter flavus TaxID=3110225 RepID=UPI002DBAD6AC|nr:DUF1801 domain-containing protein [Parapedobacter sp. 10938]MEC3880284.1 DUF1801 domain-containing protein [Parapedobacter sp. 10938]
MTAKEKIDEYINNTSDWRGELITEIRQLIHEIEPEITEEWKWNSPVFSYNGKMICSTGAFKTHVGLNFFNGAMIEDPNGLFNSGLEAKKSRSINFKKQDKIEKEPLTSLFTRALDDGKK